MSKYYCWICHKFLNDDELKICKKEHPEDIEEYPDEFNPKIGRIKNEK